MGLADRNVSVRVTYSHGGLHAGAGSEEEHMGCRGGVGGSQHPDISAAGTRPSPFGTSASPLARGGIARVPREECGSEGS